MKSRYWLPTVSTAVLVSANPALAQTCTTAADIHCGDVVLRNIVSQSDERCHLFDAHVGEVVSIAVVEVTDDNGLFGPVWRLFDPDGEPVGITGGFWCYGLCESTALLKNGRYTVQVVDDDLNGTGSYNIFLPGCPSFTGGCSNDNWNCADNWEFQRVPDNAPDQTFSVTIDTTAGGDPAEVFLDLPVEVNELHLGRSGTLSVASPDANDLTIVEPGGLVNAGTLLVGFDRRIDILDGLLRVDSEGTYQAEPDLLDVGATLFAHGVILDSPDSDIVNGEKAKMILTGRMGVQTDGDFVIQSNPNAFYACGGAATGNVAGGITPPILKVRENSTLTIAGSFILSHAASIENTSANPMRLGGDFVNGSVYPECFDCLQAALVLGGPTSQTSDGAPKSQTFEAASENRGPSSTGFDVNFGIGTLELAAKTVVRVVDVFDNQIDGEINCDETLYVRNLVLRLGSQVDTDPGCQVYFESLQNESGWPIQGCGSTVFSMTGDADCDADVDLLDFRRFHSCIQSTPWDANCIDAFDVERNLQVDLRDFASFQRRFTGVR